MIIRPTMLTMLVTVPLYGMDPINSKQPVSHHLLREEKFTYSKEIHTSVKPIASLNKTITTVQFSPDGKFIAYSYGQEKGNICIQEIYGSLFIKEPESSCCPTYAIGWHPLGTKIAYGNAALRIMAINPYSSISITDNQKNTLKKYNCVQWHPDGIRLAAGTDDGIEIWHCEKKELIHCLKDNKANYIQSMLWDSTGNYLTALSMVGIINKWNLKTATGECIFDNLPMFQSHMNSNDDKIVTAGTRVHIIDIKNKNILLQIKGADAVYWRPDYKYLITKNAQHVQIRNAQTGTIVQSLQSGSVIDCMDVSSDGNNIVIVPHCLPKQPVQLILYRRNHVIKQIIVNATKQAQLNDLQKTESYQQLMKSDNPLEKEKIKVLVLKKRRKINLINTMIAQAKLNNK